MTPRPVFAAVVALAVTAAVAGCGVRATGIAGAGGAPDAANPVARITVYLLNAQGRLVSVTRPGLPGRPYIALNQLAVRPVGSERRSGLRTEVPDAVESAHLAQDVRDGRTAGVDLVVMVNGRGAWTRAALAQLACTAAGVPGIAGVILSPWYRYRPPGRLTTRVVAIVDGTRKLTCDEFKDLR
ncbi:GerMN domain-containing protein [Actinomadura barringtoniae]|uniref:GerMN domain-containing protein n=1 Tax=Actinomadura barringtoniae TaxID=1427535 RepID=A0A939P6B2_9ACTN|nr:GerMN domain-containing protein [Actinomadura barringtoniae]MBO2446262.1 GerMN domain-containing protein [Actinomadura barringtoniae]